MKDFNIFDTNNYSTIESLLEEGNKIFEDEFIKSNLYIKHGNKQIEISFSKDKKVRLEPPYSDIEVYQKFAHVSTLGRDDDFLKIKYDAYPCSNDFCSCQGDCFEDFKVNYKENYKIGKENIQIERTICHYRMSKLYWIKHIIGKVQKYDGEVKIIQHNNKKGAGTYCKDVAFYYKSKNSKNNFIIYFEKRKKGKDFKLYFKTAFPVVLRSAIKKYDAISKKCGIKQEALFFD